VTAAAAIAWMARGAAVAAAIAALELLVVRREVARVLGGPRWLAIVPALQLAGALALPWCPAAAWLVLACTLAIALGFGGSYNGGSDAMLVIVLLAIALASVGHARAGLAYAAAQLVLSYFVSGVAKLGDPAWRAGRALPAILQLPQYRVPPRFAAVVRRLPRAATWAMLAFECGFPLALAGPAICAGALAVGAAFHLANAIGFGLNRFLWTWLAAYPALLYVVGGR
jgi:hypothetical protein